MKEAFSKSIERRNDPPRHDQGLSTALYNSHHVHAMVPMPKLAHLPGMSRDHFWSICTYPFSTNVGLNGRLLVPNLVDLVSL